MLLSEFFTPGAWAIVPGSLDAFFQILINAATPGADQTPPSLQTASPSSASGDVRPAGYFLRDGVAVIDVRGVISRRGGRISFFGMTFEWQGQDTIREAITDAMRDADVGAVLLSFDSPGGVAAGVKELADFIAAQTAKPVYAYADGLCASAAYWLAAATGRIYAPRGAEVGSIGVIAVHIDRSAANAARGIRVTYITGGARKAAGEPDAPLSASDQSYLQDIVTKLHDLFKEGVAARMPVDAAEPKAWGDGQIFLADAALELGLISGIVTDRDELIARINKEIHMDREELAKKHPELLAQIQAEARAATEKEMAVEQQKRLAATVLNMVALMTAVSGKEAAGKVARLAEAGFTAGQIEAIAPLLAAPAASGVQEQGEKDAGPDGRAEILAALRKASAGPVNTTVAPGGGDAVQAAIDQICAVSV